LKDGLVVGIVVWGVGLVEMDDDDLLLDGFWGE